MHDNSHTALINSFGSISELSQATGVTYETVRAWRNRNRIPGEYWSLLIEVYRSQRVYLTLEMLADGSDIRHKKPAAA